MSERILWVYTFDKNWAEELPFMGERKQCPFMINNNRPSCMYNHSHPTSEDAQGATYTIITPIVGYSFKTALTVHNFHYQGRIPCRAAIVALQANTYTTYPSHPIPDTHLYTWVESSNVDKVSCWRKQVPCIDGNRNCKGCRLQPFWSRVNGSL